MSWSRSHSGRGRCVWLWLIVVSDIEELAALARGLSDDELSMLVEGLPEQVVEVLLAGLVGGSSLPGSPIVQAGAVVSGFVTRPHLEFLSGRVMQALRDVEAGRERRLIVEMPPRSGKSLLATQVSPAWVLSQHPDWDIMLASYSRNLATSWGRQIRRWLTRGELGAHVGIAPDAGAVENWETDKGGRMAVRSIGADLTGFGAKVLVIDDPHKNFAEAHSLEARDRVWSWWRSDVQTRLQPPSLVIVIMTRWHEDDLVGRLLSAEHEGDPDEWEVIRFPAIAEAGDVLGRNLGDPLFSPLVEETREEALRRWGRVESQVGRYTWAALYQQRPAPARGAIFNIDDWRFWTTNPDRADGVKTILIDPVSFHGGKWLDSWDMAFKGTGTSDFVVGQRWVKVGANRYLVGQQRARMTFTETLAAMTRWAGHDDDTSPFGQFVHQRLVEDKANGAAVIDSMRDKIAGIKPVSPRDSKESRARAVTPEIESGNVLLPDPLMPGFEWVQDLLDEFRQFPSGAHDDQVDAATQALRAFREVQAGGVSRPGGAARIGSRTGAAATLGRRT